MVLDKLISKTKSEDADENNPGPYREKEHWDLALGFGFSREGASKDKVAKPGQRTAGGNQHNGRLSSTVGSGKSRATVSLLNGFYV